MKKYHRSLDLVIAATILFREGNFEKAASNLDKAIKDSEFDEMLEDLSNTQQELVEDEGEAVEEQAKPRKTRAVAAFHKVASKSTANTEEDTEEEEEDEDTEDEDVAEARAKVQSNLNYLKRQRRAAKRS